jgi:hypothetical protein
MQIEQFNSYDGAMRAALQWLKHHDVALKEAYESKFGFGMQNFDASAGYRIEFDDRTGAHINVWCHKTKGPHYLFPGNKKAVEAKWRQLFWWDLMIRRRAQD